MKKRSKKIRLHRLMRFSALYRLPKIIVLKKQIFYNEESMGKFLSVKAGTIKT